MSLLWSSFQVQEAALGPCSVWKKQAKTLNLHFDTFKEKISNKMFLPQPPPTHKKQRNKKTLPKRIFEIYFSNPTSYSIFLYVVFGRFMYLFIFGLPLASVLRLASPTL